MEIGKLISKKSAEALEHHTKALLPHHAFSEVYLYSLFPAGKLFRPCLCISTGMDLEGLETPPDALENPLYLAASALEIHHTYTLIHDDLPCMDNDDERRGRPSSHVKFGEWKALLAGDGLLNASFHLLTKANHKNTLTACKLFSWATGPKGLIQGQVMDLSSDLNSSFEDLLTTHELKTGRLIQLSLVFGMLFSSKSSYKKAKKLWRLGYALGISFQLLDDLSELSFKNPGQHELQVNPWLEKQEECLKVLLGHLSDINRIIKEESLVKTNEVVSIYFKKMKSMIQEGNDQILEHLSRTRSGADLSPLMAIL